MMILILARSGSKGLKNKNIRSFNGEPLLGRAVRRLKEISGISYVVVSSNSSYYLDIALSFGADKGILRPKYLSGDTASSLDAIRHAIRIMKTNQVDVSGFLLHQITSPLWSDEDLLEVLRISAENPQSPVITVSEYKNNPLYVGWRKFNDKWVPFDEGGYQRQVVAPSVYINGAFYRLLLKDIENGRLFDKSEVIFSKMPLLRSIDIDEEEEFQMAEYFSKKFY